MSQDPAFCVPGIDVAHSFDAACARADAIARETGAADIIVAGGAQVYAQALPRARMLWLTRVHASPDGDTRFPDFDPTRFRVTSEASYPSGPGDDFAFTFMDMERR